MSRPCISNKTLDSDNIDFVVWAAVFETYCIHAALEQDRRAELLRETGRIKHLIRSLGPPLKNLTDEMLVGVDLDDRLLVVRGIEDAVGRLDLLNYQEWALLVENDLF